MGKLTVTFHGVCTHFRGVVPGVPHRVVLPDASAFQFGLVEFEPTVEAAVTAPISYFLTPHMAVLRTEPADQQRLEIPGTMEHGNVYNGLRLQVANVRNRLLEYAPQYDENVKRLTEFVRDYEYSNEVVLGGRAVLYFDIFAGMLTTRVFSDDDSRVVATFETEGAPELLASPFFPLQTSDRLPLRIILEGTLVDGEPTAELNIANIGCGCGSEDQQFDYLLHYLTAKAGIPRILRDRTPGMVDPQSIQQGQLDSALAAMANFDFPRRFELIEEPMQLKVAPVRHDTSPACSNSGYP